MHWCLCVPWRESCHATLIPVRALSQARGRSGSKTHTTLEVFSSNQTWTNTERGVLAVFLLTGTLIFFLQSRGSRAGCQHRTSLPFHSVHIKTNTDEIQHDAACLADLHHHVTNVTQLSRTPLLMYFKTKSQTTTHTNTHISKPTSQRVKEQALSRRCSM